MVSPTPITAQPPVLSYAESAKKAQGVKPPSQHTQKLLSNPPRQPPALPPELKKPGKPTSSVEAAQISLGDLSLSDASALGAQGASVTPHTSTAESTTIHTSSTREAAPHGSPSAGSVPSLPLSQPLPVKAAPVPNVWDQRIQQRNQARSQPRPPQSQPQTSSSHVPRAASPPWDSSAASSAASTGSRQPDLLGTASVQSSQTPSSSSLNGASSSSSGSSTGTTPSSRKELLLSPHRSSSVTDAESWPEVGKSPISSTGKPQRIGNGHAAVAEEKDADVPTSSHPGTPRKSEKTKWVAIPPEELQAAAAAAINPPRPYSQSRSHSQYSNRNSQTRSTAASVSGSTHDSQTPSKVPSSRTSASHSRAHSPNSMASSPQHLGRGRQYPFDARGDQAPEQQQRSSEGNSSQAPVEVAAPVPYVQISRDVYGYGNLPTQTSSAQPFAPPPPPQPHYPPALQVNPNHTQPQYVSSTVSPYPQPYTHHPPSDRYGPAPAQPPPPSWAPAEHYVYSYGYPPYAQAHPIMYWPGNLPLDLRQDGRPIYPSYAPVHPHQQVAAPGHVLQDDSGSSREGESTATAQPTLPPPTMIARPPPPQESDAVAGYRAMGSVLDARTRVENAPRGKRDVIFGSVGAPEGSKSPSPALLAPSGVPPVHLDGPPGNEKTDRVVMTFSIGVAPGEAGPSHVRSKTRSQPRLSCAETTTDGKGPEPLTGTEAKVIDLTDSETKWEFGTANRSQDEFIQGDEIRPELLEPPSRSLAPGEPPKPLGLLFGGPLQGPPLTAELPLAELQPPYPHAHHPISYMQQQIHVPPRTPTQEELHAQTGPGPYPIHQPPPPQSLSSPSTDGFEVKDFGYGFGRGGTGHGLASAREERLPREREWDRSRETDREPWRPRRGSYSGHHERGGYAGRRARGANGFGRGPGRFGRGAFRQQQHFHQHQHQQHQQQQQQQQQHQKQQQQQQQQPQPQPQAPPFTVTPPAQAFQPLRPPTPPQRAPPDVGQYHLGTAVQPPYMPFETYQAPVPLSYPSPNTNVPSPTSGHPLPRPLSNLTFPLDPTRFYLLGQLEYYLSAQNLVSDIFLRKRMDSRGWIPISLLASFNRVRQLTLDPQLVRDVLALSQIVEMRDDCVRLSGGEWAQFVLPDAPMSNVEGSGEMGNGEDLRGGTAGGEDGEHVDDEGEAEEEEEDEEEDIEIVMDGQRWMGPSSS